MVSADGAGHGYAGVGNLVRSGSTEDLKSSLGDPQKPGSALCAGWELVSVEFIGSMGQWMAGARR